MPSLTEPVRHPPAQKGMDRRDVVRAGHAAGPDRPDGLVGDDRPLRVEPSSASEPRSCRSRTSSVRPPTFSSSVSPMHTIAVSPALSAGQRLRPNVRVRFAVVLSPLRMTDDAKVRHAIGDHFRRHVAGMRAFRLGVAVLPPDQERRALAQRRRDVEKRRGNAQSGDDPIAEPVRAAGDLLDDGQSIAKAVHLPVADNDRRFVGHGPGSFKSRVAVTQALNPCRVRLAFGNRFPRGERRTRGRLTAGWGH